jgi:hypothetical protein
LRQRGAGKTHGPLQRSIRHEHAGPDSFQQLVLGHNALAIFHEVNQQVEHPRLQVEHTSACPQLAGRLVDFKRGEPVQHKGDGESKAA